MELKRTRYKTLWREKDFAFFEHVGVDLLIATERRKSDRFPRNTHVQVQCVLLPSPLDSDPVIFVPEKVFSNWFQLYKYCFN